MKFKVGDKVKIIISEQRFYDNFYNLTTFTGVVQNTIDSYTYVDFDNSKIERAVISEDLELANIKSKQLLFEFYNEATL